jgi:hypothetical protein
LQLNFQSDTDDGKTSISHIKAAAMRIMTPCSRNGNENADCNNINEDKQLPECHLPEDKQLPECHLPELNSFNQTLNLRHLL